MNETEAREDQPNTKKPLIIGALIVTAVLAAIALITAFKLYELGLEKIIPTKEKEKEVFQEAPEEYPCRISFIIEATPSASPSPSPSASPSPSPSASPSPSPSYGCWDQCNYNSQCPSNLECLEVNNVNRCVNPSCRQETDCTCSEITPSPSPSPTPYVPGESPPPEQPSQQLPQELPEAGVLSPTLFFAIGGMILIGLGLLL